MRVSKPKQPQRTIFFPLDDLWLDTTIAELVKFKTQAGFKTTYSKELVRLAKNGLIGSMNGAKADRAVIEHLLRKAVSTNATTQKST